MSFTYLNQLPTPEEIKKEYPLSDKLTASAVFLFFISVPGMKFSGETGRFH